MTELTLSLQAVSNVGSASQRLMEGCLIKKQLCVLLWVVQHESCTCLKSVWDQGVLVYLTDRLLAARHVHDICQCVAMVPVCCHIDYIWS